MIIRTSFKKEIGLKKDCRSSIIFFTNAMLFIFSFLSFYQNFFQTKYEILNDSNEIRLTTSECKISRISPGEK